ncbi:5-(carboxyamino)imidazole ribonucleotide synthase [Robertmurraya andreesenii]|uniref:N5-carboxyaminoimidazole ribonucleotide synthase n=1 Tax=Anoxybacillus andreesenii TaxID=1325932 RepID=A0ABT9V7H7_9BACL|nr:5-(carboxyamino)imidazole ribonucleotide synthase [Robertmurraya andreesenii]MDQ0156898.1 5-(carboxyamino)imidazole ribonucleotide synthase [Robertmurraya andreesenii]
MSLSNIILPGQMIGIIGGGQLGRMMALAAKAQGFRIAVLDPTEDSPCGQVADVKIVAEYHDMKAIQELAEVSNVITYEFENIDAAALNWLCEHANVPQGKKLLEMTQNRITEKKAIEKAGAEVAPYQVIESMDDLQSSVEQLGYPCVLKTATGGYDGKGQLVLQYEEDLTKAEKLVQSNACVLEKWISFEKEISVIVTRNPNGETVVFPVGENIHKDNILHQTIVPARIHQEAEKKAIQLAKQLAEAFELVGTLAVEMFLTEEGKIYINELAPRPHNSGHYSIEACVTSQFEQHIRAVCNWPLGSTELLKSAIMVNILGEHQEKVLDRISKYPNWKIHLYGKEEAKIKRKMGHVTILHDSVEETLLEIDSSGIWEQTKI